MCVVVCILSSNLGWFGTDFKTFFGFLGSYIAPFGARRGFKMILSHMALSSFNMSSYRAIWTHFRPNSMILIQKYLVLGLGPGPGPGPGPSPGPGPGPGPGGPGPGPGPGSGPGLGSGLARARKQPRLRVNGFIGALNESKCSSKFTLSSSNRSSESVRDVITCDS